MTRLLRQWRGGDAGALDSLLPLVYQELRRLAHCSMRGERGDITLQPTAYQPTLAVEVKDRFHALVGWRPLVPVPPIPGPK